MLAGQLALVAAAAFAGAAFYVSTVEHIARFSLDDRGMLTQWKPAYARGAVMQAGLAMASGILGLLATWLTRDWRWVVGAVLILANWPYTLLVIKPTNDKLNATANEQAGPASRALLETWGRLHAIRTTLGVAATLAYLWVVTSA
jgi:hypothetical protein